MERATSPLLLLGTNNPHKVVELRALLDGCGWQLTTPAELGLVLEPEEGGSTYAENAAIKARAFAVASGLTALADDSGLEVDALGGLPGVYSARFGGDTTHHAEKMQLLLAALASVPDHPRTARFRAAFALATPDGGEWQAEGVWEGAIAESARGPGGFGYDPIFIGTADGRTAGEMTAAEKNQVSHRAQAASALLPILRSLHSSPPGSRPSMLAATAIPGPQTTATETSQPPPPATAHPGRATPSDAHTPTTPRSPDPAERHTADTSDRPAAVLSHIDAAGRARMVDVSDKDDTQRVAVARGSVVMLPETLALIEGGGIAKGNVLTTAQIAGIMAAKRTHELIPMCHALLLSGVGVTLTPNQDRSSIEIEATVRTTGKTGVEMEALTAVSVAALTVYDMCKAVDRAMQISDIRLVEKRGGKSGTLVLEC